MRPDSPEFANNLRGSQIALPCLKNKLIFDYEIGSIFGEYYMIDFDGHKMFASITNVSLLLRSCVKTSVFQRSSAQGINIPNDTVSWSCHASGVSRLTRLSASLNTS